MEGKGVGKRVEKGRAVRERDTIEAQRKVRQRLRESEG